MAKKEKEVKPPTGVVVREGSGGSAHDRIAAVLGSGTADNWRSRYGQYSIMAASDEAIRRPGRVSSGIYDVDRATHGGYIGGQSHLFYGPRGGGKTFLVLKGLAEFQRVCTVCFTYIEDGQCSCGEARDPLTVYIDSEGALNLDWAARCGVDLSRVLINQPETAEEGWEKSADLLRTGNIDIVVIDSIAFMVPTVELQGDFGDHNMGVAAKLTGQGVRAFVSALNALGNHTGRRPTIFMTNQIREKPGVIYGSPEVQPGGKAFGFAVSLEIRTRRDQPHKDTKTKQIIEERHVFSVKKARWGGTHNEGKFRIAVVDSTNWKKGDVVDEPIMVNEANNIGFIRKDGGVRKCLRREFKRLRDVENMLREDPIFRGRFRAALLKKQGIT